jgi:AcrR family transcriptional regulator
MGKLIDPEKRERARRQRVERKKRILQVARSTFSKLPFVEVTLDSIGQRADVDRGVASMYFKSKEEIFLRILREELSEWYSELEATLDRSGKSIAGPEMVEILVMSLADKSDLARLLSLEMVVLEQNLDAMETFRFQRWRRDRMVAIGTSIERAVDDLDEGGGVRLLHRAQLLTAALSPAANPRGAATYEVGDPDFEFQSIDLAAELRTLLNACLNRNPVRS